MVIPVRGIPGNVIQNFPSDHAKSILYQGGVHVPMFVSRKGVTCANSARPATIIRTEVTLDEQPAGIYFLTVSDGEVTEYIRFVKSDQ